MKASEYPVPKSSIEYFGDTETDQGSFFYEPMNDGNTQCTLSTVIALILICVVGSCGDVDSESATGPEPDPTVSHLISVAGDGTGEGTVSSDPSGIDCTIKAGSSSGICAAEFNEGTTLALTAVPDSGSIFDIWSEFCSGEGSECTITVTSDQSLTARFAIEAVREVVGTGGGKVEHPEGAVVTIPDGTFERSTEVKVEYGDSIETDLPQVSNSFTVSLSEGQGPASTASLVEMENSETVSDRQSQLWFASLDLAESFNPSEQAAMVVVPSASPDIRLYPTSTEIINTADRIRAHLKGWIDFSLVAVQLKTSDPCDDEYRLLERPEESGTDGPPLIYIHGWQAHINHCEQWKAEFEASTNGREIFGHLIEAGLEPFTRFFGYTYPTFNSIEKAGRELASVLTTRFQGRDDIVIVGHSMGGLVARAAIELHAAELEDANVDIARLITLGTPHRGAQLADAVDDRDTDIPLEPILAPILTSTEGFEDLKTADGSDGGGFIERLNTTGRTAPRSKYFVLDGQIDPANWKSESCDAGFVRCLFIENTTIGTWTPECGHDRKKCTTLAWGVELLGERNPLDGIVTRPSALGSQVLSAASQFDELSEGYDHFELRKGNFIAAFPCSDSRPCDDPTLRKVTQLVAGALSPTIDNGENEVVGINECELSDAGTGTRNVDRFEYTDPGGAITSDGAVVHVEWRFFPDGIRGEQTLSLNESIARTGDRFSGTIEAFRCTSFGDQTGIERTWTLEDAAGNTSNQLTIVFERPEGAALVEPNVGGPMETTAVSGDTTFQQE